jgi:hypothetical protein
MMLTPNELRGMRTTNTEALPEVAVVQRSTYSPDGRGGTETVTSVVGTFPARIGALSQADQTMYADKLGARVGFILVFPSGTPVEPRDRVVIGVRSFEVLASPDRGAWELTRRAVVVEVSQ